MFHRWHQRVSGDRRYVAELAMATSHIPIKCCNWNVSYCLEAVGDNSQYLHTHTQSISAHTQIYIVLVSSFSYDISGNELVPVQCQPQHNQMTNDTRTTISGFMDTNAKITKVIKIDNLQSLAMLRMKEDWDTVTGTLLLDSVKWLSLD